mmetsp:Transcript_16081/g.43706  ORF Transcript_16081/g.43706 Transcript_16081/m.43706 type:complete len:233 (+) Transcript_16081:381-1079(+)
MRVWHFLRRRKGTSCVTNRCLHCRLGQPTDRDENLLLPAQALTADRNDSHEEPPSETHREDAECDQQLLPFEIVHHNISTHEPEQQRLRQVIPHLGEVAGDGFGDSRSPRFDHDHTHDKNAQTGGALQPRLCEALHQHHSQAEKPSCTPPGAVLLFLRQQQRHNPACDQTSDYAQGIIDRRTANCKPERHLLLPTTDTSLWKTKCLEDSETCKRQHIVKGSSSNHHRRNTRG